MFTEDLFVIAKNRKHLEYPLNPSMGKRLNKLWYTCTKKYYSALKRNELLIHSTTLMDRMQAVLSGEKKPIKAYIRHDSTYIAFLK